jgi:hypothetical protein
VNIDNPEWDFTKWSEYTNLNQIELLYRKVGVAEWSYALDPSFNRVNFPLVPADVCDDRILIISVSSHLLSFEQGAIDYGFSSAVWVPTGLNDGDYEIVLHVICKPSGLSVPPPGVDEYYSEIVRGVWSSFFFHQHNLSLTD